MVLTPRRRSVVCVKLWRTIMGLLDELNLGGALKGALGQIEAAAAPDSDQCVAGQNPIRRSQRACNAATAGRPRTAGPVMARQRRQYADHRRSVEGGAWQCPGSGDGTHLGLPVDAVLNMLAQHLPNVVDQASKNGQLDRLMTRRLYRQTNEEEDMKVIAIVIASFWLGSAAMAQGMMAPAADTPSVRPAKRNARIPSFMARL